MTTLRNLLTGPPRPPHVVRVDILAYTPTEVLEETDVTVGRARELTEKYPVTWVNIVDPDAHTLQKLEALFEFHPLALEDSWTGTT